MPLSDSIENLMNLLSQRDAADALLEKARQELEDNFRCDPTLPITSRLSEVYAEANARKHSDSRRKASENALEALLTTLTTADETKSTRIPFLGSDDFSKCKQIVVSFPGAYGVAWVFLTRSDDSHFATSCIFLPDEKADGYAEHVYIPTACILPGEKTAGSRKNIYIPIPILDSASTSKEAVCCGNSPCTLLTHRTLLTPRNGIAQCFCFHLYGAQQDWGCKWYQAWMEKTCEAARTGNELIVVTKADGTLGNSQKGEVRFLEKNKFKFKVMNITDFAASFAGSVSQDSVSLLREIAGQ